MLSRMPAAGPAAAHRVWPFYIGGFIGPFGALVVNTMLPELARGLSTTVTTAASSLSWYTVPYALVMLASGTLASRWGVVRTVRIAYCVTAVAALACAVTPDLTAFMAARVLQGTANAFVSPLLIPLLAASVPPERLGRALGGYATAQAAGTAFAPLVGGAAAAVDYRLAFGVSALVALGLALVTPAVRLSPGSPLTLRAWLRLFNARLAQAAGMGFGVQFTVTAVTLFVALVATDRFGLSPTQRGLVVALYGVSGLLLARWAGGLGDRFGVRTVGLAGLALLAGSLALIGVAPYVWLLVVLTILCGVANPAARITAQLYALRSSADNPTGATSLGLSAQFVGTSLAPALVPLYHQSPALACLAGAAVGAVGVVVAWPRPGWLRAS